MNQPFNFNDIFKGKFLESFVQSQIRTEDIITTLIVTFLIASFIFFIYKLTTKTAFYSKSFNISTALIALVTASIILAMQANILISLGMVGALSIIRFRTAIKDPMDLLFLFWSISVGLICGTGMFQIAVLGSLGITIGLFVYDLIPMVKAPYLLVINSSNTDIEKPMDAILRRYTRRYKVKARNLSANHVDLTIELMVKGEAELIKSLADLPGVLQVSLLSHDGELKF